MEEEGIRLSVSVSRKVNLGNYESADVFVSLSNVEVEATDDQIRAALDTGKRVYDAVRVEVNDKAIALRGAAGSVGARR